MQNQKLSKGDIIFIKHKNIKNQITNHPLVITHFDNESITAVDQRALFAAFTLSDANSEYSKKILNKFELEKVYVPKEINPSPSGKNGVMQIDVLHLFPKDVLPKNVKGHLPEEYVDRAVQVFEVLEKANKAKFNIYNLVDVLTTENHNDKLNKLKK